MKTVTIRDIQVFNTSITGRNNTIVKVITSEPGLYGLGCATFTQRYETVTNLLENYIKPLVVGRDVSQITDLWNVMNVNAYWRNGGISNNAISGIDIALWDIKGKMANMPLYDLLGGKMRPAAEVYSAIGGFSFEEVDEKFQKLLDEGYKTIRIAYKFYGAQSRNNDEVARVEGANEGRFFDPAKYHFDMIDLFEHIRGKFGREVRLITDVHGRVHPTDAVRLAKALEKYDLFFLEDALAPNDTMWFKRIRQQCTTPLAMGEIFNNPKEYIQPIADRDFDFIRCHVSQIGGLTPAIKLAHYAEPFGIRTAWHGPSDSSPIVHTAQVHLDLASPNFGIQEWDRDIDGDCVRQAFPGVAERKGEYVSVSDRPGLGVDFDERAAKEYPPQLFVHEWTQARLPDGTISNP